MPARKGKTSGVAVTGVVPSELSVGRSYAESSLERDVLRLMRSRSDVLSFEVQPVDSVVQWFDTQGKAHIYTPDLRVVFKNGYWEPKDSKLSRPIRRAERIEVYEVKYWVTLRKQIAEFRPKFLAAKEILAKRGERFTVITEKTIRLVALHHEHFFFGYRSRPLNQDMVSEINGYLNNHGEVSVDELLSGLTSEPKYQLELMAQIWVMVAKNKLDIDHSKSPSRRSLVWIPDFSPEEK